MDVVMVEVRLGGRQRCRSNMELKTNDILKWLREKNTLHLSSQFFNFIFREDYDSFCILWLIGVSGKQRYNIRDIRQASSFLEHKPSHII